ncbi:MAG: carbon-nitrogen hydrolase family protein [Giesbergeria sp.]|nr:carbon-nitrogen hydrolase family protein [Giesbergeria sp.]
MRIAAAQTSSLPNEVAANVRTHLRFVEAAAATGVQVLVFPELSLTGYELADIGHTALDPNAPVLQPLCAAATRYGMALIVGAPTIAAERGHKPGIGAFVFEPDGSHAVYCKRYLHPGEDDYARAGCEDAHLRTWAGEPVALAICADMAEPAHADAAARGGASLYLAGVLISEAGYARDAALAQQHAARHGMGVLLANHGAPSGGYASAGRSAFWAPGGVLTGQTPSTGAWLLIAERDSAGWSARAEAVYP